MSIVASQYLPMDCPECGRTRLEVFYDPEGKPPFTVECEKCGASAFDCDDAEHSAGGIHRQWASHFGRPESVSGPDATGNTQAADRG